MQADLISIITPTYNRCSLIGRTLDSLIEQSYKNWECLVVDDGSVDYTPELLEFYCSKDPRIKYFCRPTFYPKGANSCRNYGFEKSWGQFIQWLDDDDLLSKQKLEIQILQLLEPENQESVSMTSWKFLMENIADKNLQKNFTGKKRVTIEEYYNTITSGFTFVPSNAFLVPRNLVLKAGQWNTELKINQDAEFFNRVFIKATDIIYNDNKKSFALYRCHRAERITNQTSTNNTENLIFGYRLMYLYLNHADVDCSRYFRWKLTEIRNKSKVKKGLINRHQFFFRENGLKFSIYNFKNVRHSVYKFYRFWSKRILKN